MVVLVDWSLLPDLWYRNPYAIEVLQQSTAPKQWPILSRFQHRCRELPKPELYGRWRLVVMGIVLKLLGDVWPRTQDSNPVLHQSGSFQRWSAVCGIQHWLPDMYCHIVVSGGWWMVRVAAFLSLLGHLWNRTTMAQPNVHRSIVSIRRPYRPTCTSVQFQDLMFSYAARFATQLIRLIEEQTLHNWHPA
jgi:hypothetical protein